MTKTELDNALQELAANDWPLFVSMVGQKNIDRAKLCLLKGQGKSQRFIAYKLKKSKSSVGRNCKICPDNRDANA